MANIFSRALDSIAKNFKEDASKMLIWTGVAGWTLSAIAQIGGVLFNSKIPNEQKGFLVPQEVADAMVNIGSFFLITQVTKKTVSKLFSTGKLAPSKVREFLNKNKDVYKDKIGKLNFDLGNILEKEKPSIFENYKTCKDFYTTTATIGAGVLSSNIITPIIRNNMASKMQKDYISRKQAEKIELTKPQIVTYPKNSLKI